MEDHAVDYDRVQQIIDYRFRDLCKLTRAFTHNSYAKILNTKDYQVFEFLGDSLIGFFVAEELFRLLPHADEGKLTKLRSAVVGRDALAAVVENLGFDGYLLMGVGEIKQHVSDNAKTKSDIFEALIAAVYLDGGIENAKRVALNLLRDTVSRAIANGGSGTADYKSEVNEYGGKHDLTVEYEFLGTKGDEQNRIFCFQIVLGGVAMGYGEGKTKKEAQQQAAKNTLAQINYRG